MIQRQIHFKRHFYTYWRNNVMDKSSFEVSLYFQKVIYSFLIATKHIRVYI